MKSQFVIQSHKVTLRPLTLKDEAALSVYTRQPEITDLLPDWKMSAEQLREFLQFVVNSYEQFNPDDVRILLGVIHNETQQLIGWCGVFPNDMLDDADREVAYAISKDYRNKGYITEAVQAMTSYLFEHTSLDRIVGIAKTYNPASRRVLENTGFQYVSRRRLADGEDYDYFERIGATSEGAEIEQRAMPSIRLRRAEEQDAVVLTQMCTRAFDHVIQVWAQGVKDIDSNLCPPGYASIRMHEYVIREWDYYVIEADGRAVGGVSVNVLGQEYARLDKLYIDPVCQGRGVGMEVLRLVEAEYPQIMTWRLETSGRQLSNHRFYEKSGYVRKYASEAEFGYEKKISAQPGEMESSRVITTNPEDSHVLTESAKEYIESDLSSMWFSSSTLQDSRITDCNLSGSKFQNLNMTNMLLADLRLTDSKFEFCALDGVQFQDTHLGAGRVPMQWVHCDLGGSQLVDCDLSGVQLEQCDVTGMQINGVSVDELFAAYEAMKSEKKVNNAGL